MRNAAFALCAILALTASACSGEETKDAVITVSLTLPGDGTEEAAVFSDKLLKAFEDDRAGEILDARMGVRVLEVSMKIRELSDINRIKKAIIRIEPGTEYRIEHH